MRFSLVSQSWGAVLFGTVAIAILGPSTFVTAVATDDKAGVDLEERAYTDTKTGISLRLPKGWGRNQNIRDTGFEAPTKDTLPAGSLAPNLVLGKVQLPETAVSKFKEYLGDKRQFNARSFPDYKDEPTGTTIPKIPGKEVGRIDCSFVVAKTIRLRSTQIFVVGKDQMLYVITFMSLHDTYEKNVKLFDAVTETISVP